MRILVSTALAAMTLATPSIAQEATTIVVEQSEKFGQYLATADGRPVYLFTTNTQAGPSQGAAISCTSEECLAAWPLVTTEREPQAGESVQAELLGTMEYEGETIVTYNGWPLYYFVKDEGADEPQGQDVESFGGEWYLLTPAGEELHAE